MDDDDWLSPDAVEAIVHEELKTLRGQVRQLSADVQYWREQAEANEQSLLEMTQAMEFEQTTPIVFPEVEPLRPSTLRRPRAVGESDDDWQLRSEL